MLDAHFGKEESEEMEDLGDGSDGRFATTTGNSLLDGDSGREAFDVIEVRLFQLARKLAGVGRHRVKKAALSFGEQDVKGEGRFSGARKTGDDNKFVERDVEGDVFEVVMSETVKRNLRSEMRLLLFWSFLGNTTGDRGHGLGSVGFRFGEFFRGSFEDDLAAVDSGFGAEFDDVVGIADNVELVLDDQEGIACIGEAMEDREEALDVDEVEPGGGLIEDEEAVDASFGAREKLAKFEPLGFAAGEGVEGLSEAEVAESGVDEGLESEANFGNEEFFFPRSGLHCIEEIESLGRGAAEEVGD